MEKLIELLNEYNEETLKGIMTPTKRGDYQDGIFFEKDFCENIDEPKEMTMNDTHVISKKYGFIGWLVENDKIEREQKTKEYRLQIDLDNGTYGELGGEDRLLMLLSISDTPIEDLISYLK